MDGRHMHLFKNTLDKLICCLSPSICWLDLGLDQNVDKQHFRFLLGPLFFYKEFCWARLFFTQSSARQGLPVETYCRFRGRLGWQLRSRRVRVWLCRSVAGNSGLHWDEIEIKIRLDCDWASAWIWLKLWSGWIGMRLWFGSDWDEIEIGIKLGWDCDWVLRWNEIEVRIRLGWDWDWD